MTAAMPRSATTRFAFMPMQSTKTLRWLFWLALLAFLAWDFVRAPAIDLRREPPLLAAGSGQAVQGGHCSMPGK